MSSDADPPLPKFSRYRSVSKTAGSASSPVAPPMNESISRSMSRYRRVRPVNAPAHKLPLASPALPSIPTPPEDPFKTPPRSRARTQTPSDAGGDGSPLAASHSARRSIEQQGRSDSEAISARSREGGTGKVRTRREAEPTQQSQERPGSDKQTQLNGQTSLEPQGHGKEPDSLEQPVLPARRSSRTGNFWPKSRRDHKVPPASSGSGSSRDGPAAVQTGGQGMTRGMDTPVSAVNAGERRVLVRHKQSSINLPVTPTTTPMDLIRAAAGCLSQMVDPEASILLESFNQLGLERPIRKYEHIRDVMNSWDRDTQMGLILVPSPGRDEDLESSYVPTGQPGDTSAYLYYSHKPGKWAKRWVTLRSDGQMILSKKSGGKDKDATNICHLSDFDIYSPTPKQQSEVLKSPKKICFAVKSQQKSSMFLNTANFVHYFTTDDAKLATQWYKAIQGWRSWYLVNKMGVCERDDRSGELEGYGRPGSSSHSIGSAPYRFGNFKPFLALNRHEKIEATENNSSSETESSTRAIHARRMSSRGKMPPPVSFPKKLSKDRPGSAATDRSHKDRSDKFVQGASPQEIEEATFTPSGLLGRTYSHRQKAQREKEMAEKQAGPLRPFTAGPNLLNGRATSRGGDSSDDNSRTMGRTMTMRSHRNSHEGGLERGTSVTRAKPKPLLSFDDPEFREPPQHQRKGRGILPEQLPAGGLVDMATSPEVAIPIPPSTTWRRKDVGRSNTLKGVNRPQFNGGPAPQQSPFADAAEPSDEEGFTGLLARTGPTQGASRRGRGVMNGAHAKAPMLDVSEKGRFAPGSLLARVEGAVPNDGPVIDREKWVEIDDSRGEKI